VAEEDAPLDLDRVVDEIRAAVEQRTASGEYSADLDEQLRSRVVELNAMGAATSDAVGDSIVRVAQRASFGPVPERPTSSVPGLTSVRRSIDAGRRRELAAMVARLDEFGGAVLDALQAIDANERSSRHEVDTVQDRIAEVERALRRLRGTVDDMIVAQHDFEQRIERLERAQPPGD
jgi:hypothetical protein